ncbi:hypothetical protein JTE90_027080 [Oedothorax gibbosus]|uniref:G-protein coupled receptor Mth2 n=1 Tax=Oedothorax gibbosus TaxID=931172 RepID=A0AAV6UR56_9ARAC|nr:hypothetical protein JTE90_027080 [Oedothorax gibbosus]
MCLGNAVVILLSLVSCYHSLGDDEIGHRDVLLSIEDEQRRFLLSGACSRGNYSKIDVCDENSIVEVRTFNESRWSNCRCDDLCHVYGDCCIDMVLARKYSVAPSIDSQSWSCVEVRDANGSFNRIYVHQKCLADWDDGFIRGMCEIEASERQRKGMAFDHLQHIPVLSETSRILYRNVYCAVCNRDTQTYKMESEIICFGINTSYNSQSEELDFTNTTYDPRTMMYRKVKVGGKLRNCYMKVQEFKLERLITEFGARMCKHVIDTCSPDTDTEIKRKCKAYSSYVYRDSGSMKETIDQQVYKNFYCALCNGIPSENLICRDPYNGRLSTRDMLSSMSLLFDFNFLDDSEIVGGVQSCLMSNDQMWDPVFKKCRNVTCGSNYVRNKFQCLPLNESVIGMNRNCIQIILDIDEFTLMSNGSAYIIRTMQILSVDEFEVHKTVDGKVVNIAHIHNVSDPPSSGVFIAGEVEKLSWQSSHVLVSITTNRPHFLATGSSFYVDLLDVLFQRCGHSLWIPVCFLLDECHGLRHSWNFFSDAVPQHQETDGFCRYSLYAWTSSLAMVIISVVMDASLTTSSKVRPKYGDPICWFNNKKGLLVFFVVPATILLLANISLFAATAFHIHKVSKQTKMVNNFSDKVRYYLYLKLAVVLGLTWILGLLAGITQMDAFWYPFIVLNGLQGALIFLSFTVKRNILHMLAVRLKVRSDKYRMSKPMGIKAAMYSSLSNLTLQTTTSSQIPSLMEKKDMLKSVRKINPDAIIEHHTHR